MNVANFKKPVALFFGTTIILILTAAYPKNVAAAIPNNNRSANSVSGSAAFTDTGVAAKEKSSDSERPAGISPEERAMLKLINQERMKAGLAELEVDPSLVRIAREKSKDMVGHNYFGHNSTKLGAFYNQLQAAGIDYHLAAENLAGAPDCFKAHFYLMRSPSHRSNLLNPSFKKIGIGIIKGGPYRKMITQILLG